MCAYFPFPFMNAMGRCDVADSVAFRRFHVRAAAHSSVATI